jgi:hypothetical protein
MREFGRLRSFWLVAGCCAWAAALCVSIPAKTQSIGLDAPSAGGIPGRALTVDDSSHVVVMQYEAWFGPDAVTFQNAEAMPLLQSADMQGIGGGYDSADPLVIKKHVKWMQYIGMDAALVDVSNNVGCIFSSGPVVGTFCNPADEGFRKSNQTILSNSGNLYAAWSALHTRLKLIPLLGCLDDRDLALGNDGKSGLEREAEYFGSLMARYPGLSVVFQGHPLMLLYIGTPVDTALLAKAQAVLKSSGLDAKYTIRINAGYLDSQPDFWANPDQQPKQPIQLARQYDFWSWVDRLKPAYALYPTYHEAPSQFAHRAENFTASIATAGERGWGCPQPRYCPDAALRYEGSSYTTFRDFMSAAGKLDPVFLFVHQFNEFTNSDEGWNAETSDDIEPTREPLGWGYTALAAVRERIRIYRSSTLSKGRPVDP